MLSNEYTGSTHFLDLSLGSSAEKLCLDYDWLFGKMTLPKNFVVALERERERERITIKQHFMHEIYVNYAPISVMPHLPHPGDMWG